MHGATRRSVITYLALAAALFAVGLSTTDCLAVTTVTVTPSVFILGDETAVVTLQADTASPGNALTFDVCIDIDGDGNLDPEDGRFQSFEIADGQAPHLGNEFYWHDADGAVNASVRAVLSQYRSWWLSGSFIVKVTDENASTSTAGFTVSQDASFSCVIAGEVQYEGAPAAGAILNLIHMATDRDVAMTIADANGQFELRTESPGEYAVIAMRLDAVTKFEEGSGQIVAVSDGTTVLPDPLVVFPGNRTISGKAYASDTLDGFPGTLVVGEAREFLAVTVTDDDGNYLLNVVSGEWGEITPEMDAVSRLGYIAAPRSVTVSTQNVQNFDLPCERTTTLITGTVKDGDTQQGLSGIGLFAEEPDGDGDGVEVIGFSREGGVYKFGVVEGTWWVRIEEDQVLALGYAPAPGQLVNAPASGTVSGIDFLLYQAGSISGHVYEDDGVTPVEEARVEAFEFGTWNWVGSTDTGMDGSYTLPVPSGTYCIRVPNVQGFLPMHYQNELNWEDATPVTVSAPGETSGIDFVLQRAAYIAGHVYENDGATPIEGASLDAAVFGPDWEWAASDQTEADGSYRLTVPAGTYKVFCREVPGWLNQYYDGVASDDQATPVTAIGGQETTGIDFILEPAATISGHVYREDGTTPLAGVGVSAIDTTTDEWIGGPLSSGDGSYSISVPAGSYRVWAQREGWVGEYYDDAHTYEDAAVITVVAPGETSGIDFALREATATITGHVYDEAGATPIAGATVTALEYSTDYAVGWAQTESDGSYILPVPPGTFRVSAWAPHYSLQYYNRREYHNALPVIVSGPQVIRGIDFELSWIAFAVSAIQKLATLPGVAVQWWWVPGMRYSVYWTEQLSSSTTWHEVPDPYQDIVQEGSNGGWMTWTDKGTSPGMNGKLPGDPTVPSRYYRVREAPE